MKELHDMCLKKLETNGQGNDAGTAQGSSATNEPGCATCCAGTTSDGSALLRCGQCKAVRYCSKACQRSGWKEHKKTCKAE